ncbi:MAG: dephospho-CoA kinase [Casimicrobiaceae bacterium]|nr:dephospho-CoA kinase [Casimicrobiaceae bacterium]MCX8098490.1 dephospho-CoA kinase [Casimicrobiaceae bacterium]MDW8311593.1 dephospho-CoA kinase [Burkholderiales bacterium]
MFTVGLTGGIGSGKSLVSAQLAQYGAAVIDTDQISHAITAPGSEAVLAIGQAFPGIVSASGELDRARLRDWVFADAAALERLEALMHPRIAAEVDRLLTVARTGTPYVVLVVPLLIERGGLLPRCDCVVVVDAAPEQQLERVRLRNALSAETVRRIMARQCTRDERLRYAQIVLDNTGTIESLQRQVEALHHTLLAAAQAARFWANDP